MSDIIKNQAIFNCGTAGHVSHGKSTLVHALTGTRTQKHKKEQEKNITIRLGYANSKLYLNPRTGAVYSLPSNIGMSANACDPDTQEPLQHLSTISFVDCPGHEAYMATMISGSTIMDYAMVIVAANERIPRPQTHHHLVALDYSKIEDVSFVLNKLDLVKERDVPEIKQQLDTYLKHMGMQDKLIHPVSAAARGNIGELCKYLAAKVYARVPKTIEQAQKPLSFNIVRSFNANCPNTPIQNLVGAVVGGTLEAGVLSVGDQVELRPGLIYEQADPVDPTRMRKVIQPIVARVESLESDHNTLQTAIPGGLVGVGLSIYAGLSHDDGLKGFVMGHVGSLPDMYDTLTGKYRILDVRLPGDQETPLPTLVMGSTVDLVVNGISSVQAQIISLGKKSSASSASASKGNIKLQLRKPVVLDLKGQNGIAIMLENKLIAALTVKDGALSLPIVYPKGTDMDWRPNDYLIVNDLQEYTHENPSWDEMLHGIDFRQRRIKKEIYEYPDITKINKTSYIHGDQFKALAKSLTYNQEPQGPLKGALDIATVLIENIGRELHGSKPRFNGEGNLVLDGIFHRDKIVKFIDKFVQKLLGCPSCKGTRCTLVKANGAIQRHCHNCPAVTGLHTTDIGKIA